MKAIIMFSGPNPALHGLDEHQPGALLPLGDRPFLQHVIEYLALAGLREFEMILTHLPEKIESQFGDGARWGCRFTYHLAAGDEQSWRILRNICAGCDDTVVLAQSDSLPMLRDFKNVISAANSILCGTGERQASWSGWASFPAKSAPLLFPNVPPEGLNGHLLSCAARGEITILPVELALNCRTPEGLLQSQHLLLSGGAPELMINGNQAEKGICIGHGAAIHPTARLIAPLYIGPNSRIGARAQVGPGAVVSGNCIIDDETSIVNSIATPGTYIGQGLELDGVVVDRNRLVNSRLGTSCLISESFLVGSLSGTQAVPLLRGMVDRVIALVLYFFTLPVLLWMFVRSKSGSGIAGQQSQFVRLTASEDPRTFQTAARRVFERRATSGTRWQHFTDEFVPGLLSVVRGQLNLVGVPPRSERVIQQMPVDWRGVYLSSKAGLITEALVVYGSHPSVEEAYSADAFYRAMESAGYDCRLLARYLGQVVFEPQKRMNSEIVGDCEAK
jgi:NDP-sugar pyrophosphorylase family protein